MLFVELRFFVFFAIGFGVYWALRRNELRKIWLLGCSYAFYGAWNWKFLSLIVISTFIDYVVGIMLDRHASLSARRGWLFLSVAANLSMLGVFKYYNFFAGSLADLGDLVGVPITRTTLDVVLPVGISFYTFQTMSYSLDIYFGRMKPTRSLLDVALFVAFFPQLVAGPIVRARNFLPQLLTKRTFLWAEGRGFLVLFLIGFFKKACVSDNLAPYVDQYFASPASWDVASAWIAVVFYAAQIYCDFSGYSDMAIACAGLLGFRLGDNFAFPYFARSITDFWRRWHMSLSSWLRDYLYIPLGGSRGSRVFTYRNLMITMLLGGLWHGASWNFVIWGGMHGAGLVAHRQWCGLLPESSWARRLTHHLGVLMTFYWVCLSWILFRAETLADATTIFGSFALFQSPGMQRLAVEAPMLIGVLLLLHWLFYRRTFESWWLRLPRHAFAAAYGAAFSLAVALVPMDHRPFIYFQF